MHPAGGAGEVPFLGRLGVRAWGLREAGIAFTAVVAAITLAALAAVLRLSRRAPMRARPE